MTHTKLLPLLLALSAVTAPTLAQPTGSLKACRAITEQAARLACYDALPLPTDAPAAARAAAPAPAGAATAATQAPANPTSGFGLEAKAAQATPDAIDSHIEGRFEGWGAKSRIRLANGQVWEVTDGSRGVLNLNSPKVRVRKGVLGAFYMDIEGTNRSPKVRRVE
jgi:hypothetical protein